MRLRSAIVAAAAAVLAVSIFFVISPKKKRPVEPQSMDLKRRFNELRAVPYTSVTEEEVTGEPMGITKYDRGEAYRGYNIYCSRVSPEALLMDMEGKIVHRWTYPEPRKVLSVWDYGVMLPDGDALVIRAYGDLKKLDWQSDLIWQTNIPANHDVAVAPDGTLYVIVTELKSYRELLVRFPVIVHLGSDGEGMDKWSAYDHLEDIKQTFDQRSFLDTFLDSLLARGEDPRAAQQVPGRVKQQTIEGRIVLDMLHLNSVSIIPDTPLGRVDPRFAAGNLLICFRNVNQIAILEKNTKRILWIWGEGVLEWPHHPTMLANGNILIFDNGPWRKYSRVVEANPVSGQIEWEYVANPRESFYSFEKGSAQRLPNGNTLICESDRGRAFEVTREGKIVWEWLNPMTKKGHRVQVYRMMRLPPEMVEGLLSSKRGSGG